jgi:hypothetical protein
MERGDERDWGLGIGDWALRQEKCERGVVERSGGIGEERK